MIVSWNWLSQYVRMDVPVEVLTERLALSGLNHESTEEVGGDLAIDLEVTSNRSDCLGHLGVAREISVLTGARLSRPKADPLAIGGSVKDLASVIVEEPMLCPRFTAQAVTGVTIGESPWWMKKRLETLGIRPISNVVDVTNYVMFECGQPIHAYDLDRLREHRLVVRKARARETLRAINNKDYALNSDMLVIADAVGPVGLAGVMGGLETEISSGTTRVLIEAAQFDAMSVRKTSRALGLFSPSSHRFERTIDPEITAWANRRCAELILETAGGTLHAGMIDIAEQIPERPLITLRLSQIARVLGIEVDRKEVERILKALGVDTEPGPNALTCQAPSWRGDLEREIDLIEEVARIHGYHHVPEDRAIPLTSTPRGTRERVEEMVRESLIGAGFDEAATFSLVADELAHATTTEAALSPIQVDHSSRRRERSLRQSLILSLLEARRYNESHGNQDASLFEIADVYLPMEGDGAPRQPTLLTMVSGHDFFGLKGLIEALVEKLHVGLIQVSTVDLAPFAPGRSARLRLGGEHLGFVGEIDSARLDALNLRSATSAAELELGILIGKAGLVPQYQALPPFPAVTRDLSLEVDRSLSWGELSAAVAEAAGPELETVTYLDAFRGGNLGESRQSLHFGLKFRHPARTLTGEEVDRSIKAIVSTCARRFNAALRT